MHSIVRPIRQRLEHRVKAHIFLSMPAYYVQWHMIEAWKSLIFADEAGADAQRLADPVAPARRSKAALATAHKRRLPDGSAVMSFQRLLAHLGSIVRNTVRPIGARADLTLQTPLSFKGDAFRATDVIAAV